MSLLERIKLIEDAIIDLSDNQKIFLEMLDNINGKLDRILVSKGLDWASGSEKEERRRMNRLPSAEGLKGEETANHLKGDDSKLPEVKKEDSMKEEVDMDLAQVLLMKETEKAFLIVKHGFQVWVAKSHLQDSGGYDLGNTYDLKVKEKSKWILKKLDWEPFEVFKN